jgi:hypothetical protein
VFKKCLASGALFEHLIGNIWFSVELLRYPGADASKTFFFIAGMGVVSRVSYKNVAEYYLANSDFSGFQLATTCNPSQ